MRSLRVVIFSVFLCLIGLNVYAQNKSDIIDGKNYNQKFYIKAKLGSGVSHWWYHFPKGWIDTSKTLPPINGKRLKFYGKSQESVIGFSGLFGLPWGLIGGGFEASRMRIDSLEEVVNGETVRLSFADSNMNIGFNKFYVEYESLPIYITKDEDLALIFDFIAGTFVLFPVSVNAYTDLNLFGSFGPMLDVEMVEWAALNVGLNYEFRYFSRKELFFSEKWIFRSYQHSYYMHLSIRFCLNNNKKTQKGLPKRVQ